MKIPVKKSTDKVLVFESEIRLYDKLNFKKNLQKVIRPITNSLWDGGRGGD